MQNKNLSLTGKLLIAMPGLGDPRFHKSIIFICRHDENSAMGLVTNHPLPNMTLGELIDELKLNVADGAYRSTPVLVGGPVETTRGFLLHTPDYHSPETITVNEKFNVSGTVEALTFLSGGLTHKEMIFTLGYAGWGKGQLEQELLDNAWIVVDADYELLFNTDVEDRWSRALFRHGIDPARLSGDVGHA